jgi:hypothetical protein
MRPITRRHKIFRILILVAAAFAWMGPPRPPGVPGCRGPRPPMPYHEMHDARPPAAQDAAGGSVSEPR